MVLFNMKGFFNNINHDRMVAILENLGFNENMTEWVQEFLRDRQVHLGFNCITSEERVQLVGVPQGSPLSPMLSIIYTLHPNTLRCVISGISLFNLANGVCQL